MKEYWLIFKQGNHWTRHFCRKKYSHITVITKDEFNWIRLEPTVFKLEVEILNATLDNDVVKAHRMVGYKCIYLRVDPSKRCNFLSFVRLSNCVEMIKYYTGLKLWAWTPYGLYKKLCKYSQSGVYPYGIESIKIII